MKALLNLFKPEDLLKQMFGKLSIGQVLGLIVAYVSEWAHAIGLSMAERMMTIPESACRALAMQSLLPGTSQVVIDAKASKIYEKSKRLAAAMRDLVAETANLDE